MAGLGRHGHIGRQDEGPPPQGLDGCRGRLQVAFRAGKQRDVGAGLGTIAVGLAAINTFGGFLVSQRMLEMFRKKEPKQK